MPANAETTAGCGEPHRPHNVFSTSFERSGTTCDATLIGRLSGSLGTGFIDSSAADRKEKSESSLHCSHSAHAHHRPHSGRFATLTSSTL